MLSGQVGQTGVASVSAAWQEHKRALMYSLLGARLGKVAVAIPGVWWEAKSELAVHAGKAPAHTKLPVGCALATLMLSHDPRHGAFNDEFQTMELVSFSPVSPQAKPSVSDLRADLLAAAAGTCLRQSVNPGDVVELVVGQARRWVVFEGFAVLNDKRARAFGLMLVMEIHPAEAEYAQTKGGAALTARLRQAGHHPVSTLDRPSVA